MTTLTRVHRPNINVRTVRPSLWHTERGPVCIRYIYIEPNQIIIQDKNQKYISVGIHPAEIQTPTRTGIFHHHARKVLMFQNSSPAIRPFPVADHPPTCPPLE